MTRNMLALFTVASLITLSTAYQYFQSSIPNGNKVPDPCKPGSYWGGVGHWSPYGANERNPFGLAFKANGKSWTKALCQADSDGDGKTNGEELGDPNCIWSSGATPERTSSLSHPGICEPPASTRCMSLNTVNVCNVVLTTQKPHDHDDHTTAPQTIANATAARTTMREPTRMPTLDPTKIPVMGSSTVVVSVLLLSVALLAAIASIF